MFYAFFRRVFIFVFGITATGTAFAHVGAVVCPCAVRLIPSLLPKTKRGKSCKVSAHVNVGDVLLQEFERCSVSKGARGQWPSD